MKSFDETWSAWRKANYYYFENKLQGKKGTLVDLGSGEEQFQYLFKNFEYIAVDFEKYFEHTIIADLMEPLPFSDHHCSVVTLSNTIEHLPDPRIVLSESWRILKNGGHIIGTVPFLVPEHQMPVDFNRYTHVHLEKLLSDAGFSNIKITSLGKQMDVYNNIELKVFDELRKNNSDIILEAIRTWRRLEMRFLRKLYTQKASLKTTEGYGFVAQTKK